MNPVVHFEMPSDDSKRMSDFYAKAFGWQSQMLGPEMGEYVVVTTSEVGPDKTPLERGRINGGFYKRANDKQHPSIVIGVEDIHAAMKRVEDAGGKIIGGQKLGEPDDIPGVGLFIAFEDTEGNYVAMLQPTMQK